MSYWLSFADGALPEGTQFLGAAIVRADDMIGAVALAHALGINPGGEALGFPVPAEMEARLDKWRDRLLTRAECEAMDRELLSS